MLCKHSMVSLDYKSKKNNANTFFLPFPLFFLFLKGITKTTYHEMHECYAMQILKTKTKTKNSKEEWSQRVLR